MKDKDQNIMLAFIVNAIRNLLVKGLTEEVNHVILGGEILLEEDIHLEEDAHQEEAIEAVEVLIVAEER